jgi:hypothetical protein
MSIRLHVDSLILEGLSLSPVERTRLEHALVDELTRFLREGHSAHAFGKLGVLPVLSAPGISIEATDNGASIGAQIAQSIYGSLVPQEISDRHNEADSRMSTT